MPWREVSGGYTKKTKSGTGGGFIRNPRQYEKLRGKGFSKESAARITNFHKGFDPFEISKSRVVASERGRKARRVDQNYERKLSTKELRGAGLLGVSYTAAKAPKGRRLRAIKQHNEHRIRHPYHSTREGAFGYAKQKWEEDLTKHYLGRHREPYSPHTRAEHRELRATKKAVHRAAMSQANTAYKAGFSDYAQKHPFIHGMESGLASWERQQGRVPNPLSADVAGSKAMEAHWRSPKGQRAIAAEERARGKWNPRYERKRKAQIAANRQLAMSKSAGKAAAVFAGGALLGGGVNEGVRRYYRRKGADISVREQYRHPMRTQYAQAAAGIRSSAERRQAKVARTGNSRTANAANRRRMMATHRAGEAQMGSLRYYRSLPPEERRAGFYRYDRERDYTAPVGPIGLHKSAFGVDHEDITKISFGALGGKVDQFFGGAKGALRGKTFGQTPNTTAGSLGAKTGNMLRQTGLNTKKNLKPIGVGAGIGVAGAGGIAALNSDRY